MSVCTQCQLPLVFCPACGLWTHHRDSDGRVCVLCGRRDRRDKPVAS